MRKIELPNGLEIVGPAEYEGLVVYHEIFATQTYARHGITVNSGDCVFDIGANVGLYSMYLAQQCQGLRIFAFEPIPAIYAALEQNISSHADGSTVRLFNVGIGEQSGTAHFRYNRFSSITATMRGGDVADAAQKKASIYDWIKAGLLDLHRIARLSDGLTRLLVGALTVPILKTVIAVPFVGWAIWLGVREKLFGKDIECPLKTVSQVIAENHLDVVNLLKVDVEGSELAVIGGIEAADWPKIQQAVIEIHDTDGRVTRLRDLFEEHGFRTAVDQEEWELHKLLGIFTLYATR